MLLQTPTTLSRLAEILNCKFLGNPNHQILGFNEIHMVNKGDLTFVDVQKYYDKALNSKATTILINNEVDVPEGKALLIHSEPFTAYNLLTEYFQPRQSMYKEDKPIIGKDCKISQRAVFGTNVKIGNEVEISHLVVIGNNVTIGDNTIICPNVTIMENSVIGNDVFINPGTVIGGEAFYFKSRKESKEKLLTKGRVVIHDHVDIGANCTIDRGVSGDTVIGEWTKLDNLIQIGHDTVIGKRCIIASQVGIAGVVTVEDDVIIWGQVGINKDLNIGKGTVLMGKTGVISSLEGNKKYLGMIATEHRQMLRQEVALRKLPELIAKIENKRD